MSDSWKKMFLAKYLYSLSERSREETKRTQYGIDWVFYNLGLSEGWTPLRLPFFRGQSDAMGKSKTETEFGVDLLFQSKDRKTAFVFVLKDEPLRNSTWTKNDFDGDLRRAACLDLDHQELSEIEKVVIVLGYNKDEDRDGIRLYENLIKSLGTTIRDTVVLEFERWNLTTIVNKTEDGLLDATLLPQKFYSLFSYICSQFADFRHGSEEWEKQLVPNWNRFLDDLLDEKADDRSLRMVPVCLQIISAHAGENSSAETGLIDLMEWAILKCWKFAHKKDKKSLIDLVRGIWLGVYLVEIEQYFSRNKESFSKQFGVDVGCGGSFINAVASSVIAHWHLSRLGLLAVGTYEFIPGESDDEKAGKQRTLSDIANRLVELLNGNPGTKRPLIDLHHIEVYLVFRTLLQVQRIEDIAWYLVELSNRLLVRRFGAASFPFIESSNNLELVFEYAATGRKPPEFTEQSSYLLQMILEISSVMPEEHRPRLLDVFYRQIGLGQDSSGENIENAEPLDLMVWEPPSDWVEHLHERTLSFNGTTQCVGGYDLEQPLEPQIRAFVDESRRLDPMIIDGSLPASFIMLSCLKQNSPLPPEFWRLSLFGPNDESSVFREPA